MPSKSPDAFRTISEVAEWLQTPAHVLRFWESKFSQVKPVKRAGGRRYYRPVDMALIGGIKKLLHDDGMTIKGVQKVLREQGIKYVSSLSPPLDEDLEAMIAPAIDAEAVPSPETGQVLDFSGRPGPNGAEPVDVETPAAPPHQEPSVAKDLFDEDGDDIENVFVSDSGSAETGTEPAKQHDTTNPSPADTVPLASKAASIDLPEMPEAPDHDEGRPDVPEPDVAASISQEAAPQSITPEDASSVSFASEDAAADEVQAEPSALTTEPDSLTDDLPDFLQKPMSERMDEEAVADPDETVPETQTEDASVNHAPDNAENEAPVDDTASQKVVLPEDPQDHELGSPTGPLTLLTSPEMRAARHSAERIETLIIRVRNHQRAMSHAARG